MTAPLQTIGSAMPDVALPTGRRLGRTSRLALVIAALWLFLSAISVMKTGAGILAPSLQGSIFTDSVSSTLGFGWIGALLVMSGSPIAVASLTMLSAGVIDGSQALTMLTGSRLGAAFVVLAVSFIYALRGRSQRAAEAAAAEAAGTPLIEDREQGRRAAVSIGIFSLLLTAAVYIPALAIGLPLLRSGAFDRVDLAATGGMLKIVDVFTGPLVNAVTAVTPDKLIFLAGLILLLASVRLIDLTLPEAASTAQLEGHTGWRNRRWMMFAIGSLVALVTMSVSVALTVLVPAVAKGYFRRRQVMPYIMGANITTLGDTLFTAVLTGDPMAVHVVLVELATIVVITAIWLGPLYKPLTEAVVRVTDWLLDSRLRTGIFVAALFCVPISLIAFL